MGVLFMARIACRAAGHSSSSSAHDATWRHQTGRHSAECTDRQWLPGHQTDRLSTLMHFNLPFAEFVPEGSQGREHTAAKCTVQT
jgi:hypothetical protein